MVGKIRNYVLTQTLNYPILSTQALDAVDSIKNAFNDSIDQVDNAWGQYINPPRYREHVGIYGTSSAVKTLSLGGLGEYRQEISEAQRWLVEEQWENDDSDTARKGHRAVLYKLVFLTMAIKEGIDSDQHSPFTDSEQEAKFVEYCEQIWGRRVDWGWGEFWYEGSDRSSPSIDTSALALSVLVHCDQIRTDSEFEETLENVSERALRQANSVTDESLEQKTVLTDTALILYALSVYKKKTDRPGSWLSNSVDDLVSEVNDLVPVNRIDPNTYDFRFFSTPRYPSGIDRDEIVEDRYIIHIVYPIVGLALITAGEKYTAKHYRLVRDIIEIYVYEIQNSSIGVFTSEETDKAAHVDQFWIAQALHAFSAKLDPEGFPLQTLIRRWLVPGIGGRIAVLVIIGILLFAGWQLRQGQSQSALEGIGQILAVLSAGYILEWEFGDLIGRSLSKVKSVFQ